MQEGHIFELYLLSSNGFLTKNLWSKRWSQNFRQNDFVLFFSTLQPNPVAQQATFLVISFSLGSRLSSGERVQKYGLPAAKLRVLTLFQAISGGFSLIHAKSSTFFGLRSWYYFGGNRAAELRGRLPRISNNRKYWTSSRHFHANQWYETSPHFLNPWLVL